jgi:hypothetical protein
MFDALRERRRDLLQSRSEPLERVAQRLALLNPENGEVALGLDTPSVGAPGSVPSTGSLPALQTPGSMSIGGGRSAMVAEIAGNLRGSLNADYYPADPAEACASFVSAVLVRAGVLRGPEGVVGGGSEYTRSTSQLRRTLLKDGAREIAYQRSVKDASAIASIQPGDLIFWSENGLWHHSGIYAGNGQQLSISSSRGRVLLRGLDAPGWSEFSAVRLP